MSSCFWTLVYLYITYNNITEILFSFGFLRSISHAPNKITERSRGRATTVSRRCEANIHEQDRYHRLSQSDVNLQHIQRWRITVVDESKVQSNGGSKNRTDLQMTSALTLESRPFENFRRVAKFYNSYYHTRSERPFLLLKISRSENFWCVLKFIYQMSSIQIQNVSEVHTKTLQ